MIKIADKPSTDPVQQKLRLAKKQWNKDVSAFIDDLIHYKKLTNGQPNKFYKERSSIKEPIPADPMTIIGSLANDFQELAQRANAIIAAQLEYSKTRRKKQLKAPATPAVSSEVAPPLSAPVPDLSKQLAAFEQKYGLIVEGSNPITRFFTRLLTPTFGVSEAARIRKYRMSLLSASAKFSKSVEKFQVEIVKSSPESIINAYKLLHTDVWNDWMLLYRGFATYKANMPAIVKDTGGEIAVPDVSTDITNKKPPISPPQIAPAPQVQETVIDNLMNQTKTIITDYSKNYRRLQSTDMGGRDTALEANITKFLKSPGQYKPLIAPKVIEEYKQLISDLNKNLGTNGASMGDIAKQLQDKNKTAAAEQLEKVSQDFLKKWLGKTKHQLSVFDKTSVYRLDIYKMGEEVRDLLDQMMNSLEKGMNVEELNSLIMQINQRIINLKGLMRALYTATPAKNKPRGMLSAPEEMNLGQRLELV